MSDIDKSKESNTLDLLIPELSTPVERGDLGESEGSGCENDNPLTIKDRIFNLFRYQRSEENLNKQYPFKVKSIVTDDITFRFQYPPRNGFERLRKYILDRIHYAAQNSENVVFSLGYFDATGELITITNDDDLYECVHSFNLNNKHSYDILLVAYNIEDHLKIATESKGKHQREHNIRTAIGLTIFLCAFPFMMFVQ